MAYASSYEYELRPNVGVKNYIIVVETMPDRCMVKRIVESPSEGTVDSKRMYGALENTWKTLVQQYPWPRYDIVSGRGTLYLMRSELPGCSGWNVPIEGVPGL